MKINTIQEILLNNSTRTIEGCHILNRADANHSGHRRITIKGKRDYGHRYAAQVIYGEEFDADSMICHLCNNPPCCNPEHVYMGNAYTNKVDEIN